MRIPRSGIDVGTRRWWILLLAATAVHVVVAVATPISGDEAYYWDCSRHPDWSYFDQPPLVIWLMIPFRLILGETALAVRGPAILASLLIGVFLLPLARRLGGGPREAGVAYAILHATPLVLLGSSYTSTDVLMTAWYVGAAWGAVAIAQDDVRGWWTFGAFAGIGFLTKFPMVAAVLGLVPTALSRPARAHLRGATPWLAAIGSLALTSPVWIWGARHDWDNLTFQFGRVPDKTAVTIRYVLEFAAANLALATPFVGIAMVVAWWGSRARREPAWSALRWIAVAPLVLFGAIALRGRVAAHWGAPTIVLSALILAFDRFRGWKIWVGCGASVSAILLAVVLTVSAAPEAILAAARNADDGPWSRVPAEALEPLVGYDETVEAVRRRLAPGEIVASESYTWVHKLAFESRGTLPVRLVSIDGGRHGLASLYWYPADRLDGTDVLWVTSRPRTLAALREICRSVDVLEPIDVVHDDVVVRRIDSYRCRDIRPPAGAAGRAKPRGLELSRTSRRSSAPGRP